MSETIIPKIKRENRKLILDNEKLRRGNARVQAGVVYKAGDLLVLDYANRLYHPMTEEEWHVVCGQNVTAQESTIKANDGVEIPIYFGGVFNIEAVTRAGLPFRADQYDALRSTAIKNNIELTKMENT